MGVSAKAAAQEVADSALVHRQIRVLVRHARQMVVLQHRVTTARQAALGSRRPAQMPIHFAKLSQRAYRSTEVPFVPLLSRKFAMMATDARRTVVPPDLVALTPR